MLKHLVSGGMDPQNPNMDVSKNGGTQQQWVFLLKMIILGCFGGTPIFGNTHILISEVLSVLSSEIFLRNLEENMTDFILPSSNVEEQVTQHTTET